MLSFMSTPYFTAFL